MGDAARTVVSSKGWIVIPAELRHRYGLKPGTRIQIVDYLYPGYRGSRA